MPNYWNTPISAGYVNPFWPYPTSQYFSNAMFKDHGKEPYVVDIDQASKRNNTFRTAIWTGSHLQVVLMSINVGE
ncbi:MAG TPA: cupin domain-containing protein, partial [Bacillales bacterium]|nr:cupin domain-containing protein [Bacillales bacterium]